MSAMVFNTTLIFTRLNTKESSVEEIVGERESTMIEMEMSRIMESG